ncbi:ribonuclease H [Aliarcobacter cryaerophilus ATCC 43158]|uniref:Ribonuclease H family protein n=1 Tax=Aliarcobacter cryaerophilus ATCC 43158 TaxID=1032070 RepID=A0AAD0TUZ1_9BACT|nr:RNase H family protein [Aliarcobacter cryaerophilus]AYJ79969.1 ribonuclease H family protein [Aliarcobacter cryaerophilus ATCC 43158]PRM97506.1 ribonuclease H [Aliarcobacter cryaerophilus]QCZ24810.1 ribonuclease H [Aliarcobacter cryaerophilus ATCC 43158]
MKKIELFTDSSVNPQSKIGFAAFLVKNDKDIILEKLNKSIKIKKFENTSSTRLELQALLWAINQIEKEKNDLSNILIDVYTDCQNIVNLKTRKYKLIENNYHSGTGKLIKNCDLYKEFFEKESKLNLNIIKVKGHKKTILKDNIDNIFNLVDKASRSALRNEFKDKNTLL